MTHATRTIVKMRAQHRTGKGSTHANAVHAHNVPIRTTTSRFGIARVEMLTAWQGQNKQIRHGMNDTNKQRQVRNHTPTHASRTTSRQGSGRRVLSDNDCTTQSSSKLLPVNTFLWTRHDTKPRPQHHGSMSTPPTPWPRHTCMRIIVPRTGRKRRSSDQTRPGHRSLAPQQETREG